MKFHGLGSPALSRDIVDTFSVCGVYIRFISEFGLRSTWTDSTSLSSSWGFDNIRILMSVKCRLIKPS